MFRKILLKDEQGQGLVEYALILVMVAIIVLAVLLLLGPQVGGVFSNVVENINRVTGGGSAASFGAPEWGGANVTIDVTVTQPGTYTGSASSGSLQFASRTCNPNCTFKVLNASPSGGTLTISGPGGTSSVAWPASP